MALKRMPNGEYVDVPEGMSAEALSRVQAENSTSRKERRAASPAQQIRDRDTAFERKHRIPYLSAANETLGALRDNVSSALTFGLTDKLEAGIGSLTGGGNYRDNREAVRLKRVQQGQDSPIASTVGTVAGTLMNPVGAETGAARLAAKVAPKALAAVRASRTGRAAARLGNTSIGLGARAGFNQAALQAASDGDLADAPRNAVNGGASGAIFGGAAGGLLGAGAKVGRALKDRSVENASRVAYERVGDMVGRARNADTGINYTPRTAARELRAAKVSGTDPMLADLSPEMQGHLGYLARKPGLKAANEIVERSTNRVEGAIDRFDSNIERLADTPTDAYSTLKATEAGRKAAGKADYAPGGTMDTPISWTREMGEAFAKSPDADRWLKQGYLTAERFDEPFAKGVPDVSTGPFDAIPTFRAFDYMKRAADSEIKTAVRAGNDELASGLSKQKQRFVDMLDNTNPDYAKIRGVQRDAYQQKQALEVGQGFLARLRKDPRGLLDELKASPNPTEVRMGMADALLQMHNTTDSPVVLMRRLLRSDDQKAVLEHLFGGPEKLGKFARFLKREMRQLKTDSLTSGKQSATDLFKQHGEADDAGGAFKLFNNTLRGATYGGKAGFVSAGIRTVDELLNGVSPAVREEMAKILTGQGKGLAKGINDARTFASRRAARDARNAVLAGKLGSVGAGVGNDQGSYE